MTVKQTPLYGYHVHIYFTPGQSSEKIAVTLTEEMEAEFHSHINEILVYRDLVGPHPQPNYALHIKTSGFAGIVGGLQLDNRELSILVHPETGNEEADHAQRAMWIGKPVALNMAYFHQTSCRCRACASSRPTQTTTE